MNRNYVIIMLIVVLLLTACSNGQPTVETVSTEVDTELVTEQIDYTEITAEQIDEATAYAATNPEPTEAVAFSQNISFSGTYITEEDLMPYAFFAPSCADGESEMPLIVFLHGLGERDAKEPVFMDRGMTKIMVEWEMEGFRAYVVCPQLYGRWNTGYWYNPEASENLKALLEHLQQQYPIDQENVCLVGFSAGGIGALYMAREFPESFSKMVVMSAPAAGLIDLELIKIPTVGYCETDVSSGYFMRGEFTKVFGTEHVFYYDVPHAELPGAAFGDDADGNNRSDLVEWMLQDSYEWELPTEE